MTDTGFKLIAIRPLKDCPKKYLKNLKEGMIYSFYDGYDFYVNSTVDPITTENYATYSNQPLSKCVPKKGFEHVDLYSVRNDEDPSKNININISAVVGKNGSGKSSLIELFFLSIFKLSVDNEFITYEKGKDVSGVDYDLLENLKKEMSPWEDIKIDIVFEINGELKVLNSDNSKELFKKTNLGAIFYSICLNYSLYGLNSIQMGAWIEKLFHKNDSYLTPLVINPMRTEGVIDVNKEFSLNQTRFLTNLIDTKLNENILLDGKQIQSIRFTIPYIDEMQKKIYYYDDNDVVDLAKCHHKIFEEFEHCNRTHSHKFDLIDYLKKNHKEYSKIESTNEELQNYLNFKLFKIAKKYEAFKQYIDNTNDSNPTIINIKGYISSILSDKTHVTLKFRQILYNLKFGHIINNNTVWQESDVDGMKSKYFELSFSDFKNKIQDVYTSNKKKLEISELIPAAFFHISLKFKRESEYTNLSSGELQMLNSINTILYHLSNLDSKTDSYSNVNIILDEIELYYHPDFQRKFIDKLLKNIAKIQLENIKSINILFATHSSFILSDIPTQNVLKLEDGKPVPDRNGLNSFAANIHDLLNDDFFLNEGFMGEFAKNKINEVADELENSIKDNKPIPDERLKQIEGIIDLVGEPILKESLTSLYSIANPTGKNAFIDAQIAKLLSLKTK